MVAIHFPLFWECFWCSCCLYLNNLGIPFSYLFRKKKVFVAVFLWDKSILNSNLLWYAYWLSAGKYQKKLTERERNKQFWAFIPRCCLRSGLLPTESPFLWLEVLGGGYFKEDSGESSMLTDSLPNNESELFLIFGTLSSRIPKIELIQGLVLILRPSVWRKNCCGTAPGCLYQAIQCSPFEPLFTAVWGKKGSLGMVILFVYAWVYIHLNYSRNYNIYVSTDEQNKWNSNYKII